ncbi:MAG: tetratricopeptide repeat protein [Candidatus Aquicultorales bacterium]
MIPRTRVSAGRYFAAIGLMVLFLLLAAGCSKTAQEKAGKRASAVKTEASKLYAKGKYADAEAKLRAYLKDNPDDYEARVLLSSALIVIGKTEDAYVETKKAYEAKKSPDVAYQLALLGDKLGKKNEAVSFLEAAVSSRPESLPFKTALADLYLKYKEFDEAISVLKAASDKEPRGSAAWKDLNGRLASAYEAAGNVEKALEIRSMSQSDVSTGQ